MWPTQLDALYAAAHADAPFFVRVIFRTPFFGRRSCGTRR
jgi:hypothetical protein